MADELIRQCQNCRFWHWMLGQQTNETSEGDCRRNTPLMLLGEAKTYLGMSGPGAWPRTAHDDWCGEWQWGSDRYTKPEGLTPEQQPDTSRECKPNG
jgi:hypothetical protein